MEGSDSELSVEGTESETRNKSSESEHPTTAVAPRAGDADHFFTFLCVLDVEVLRFVSKGSFKECTEQAR